MSDLQRFSDVSQSYIAHAGNLNRARQAFEEEAREFAESVMSHLLEARTRPRRKGPQKTRWRAVEDWSSAKDGTWLNFLAGSQIRLDIRQPGFRNFRNAAGYLYFQIVYARTLDRFVFQARFENQNSVHAQLDEAIIELARHAGEEAFPVSFHLKRNTAIIFRRDLGGELAGEISQIIDEALALVERAVDSLFPDALYQSGSEAIDPEGDDAPLDEELTV